MTGSRFWNPTPAPADVTGWHLTDNASNLRKWRFPATVIAPGEYLIVFASEKPSTATELHASFKLSADGEYLALSGPGSSPNVVHQYSPAFPRQTADRSFGLDLDGVIGYLALPTPRAANSGIGQVETPTASVAAGFYSYEFEVVLHTATPDATIMFTTDGSQPSVTHGTPYTSALHIASTTSLRAVTVKPGFANSKVMTTTYLFAADVIAQSGTPPGWPAAPVNDQAFRYGMDQSLVAGNVDELTGALTAIPSVAITTDLASLVDPSTGIYVNASERGSAWERPVSVELIDPQGGGFHIDAGLRIRGSFSRDESNPKHSFRLSFTNQYGGPLRTSLFRHGVDEFAALDLRTEQNYAWHRGSDRNTMLREVWSRDTQNDAGGFAADSFPVHLYLNGVYWGMYQLEERIGDDLAAAVFGGDADDYDVVKHGPPLTEVEDGSIERWNELWPMVEDLVVDDIEYATLANKVDLERFVDYSIIRMYAGDSDATVGRTPPFIWGNNWYGLYGHDDGQPWTFSITDAEHSLGAFDHDLVRNEVGSPDDISPADPDFVVEQFHPGYLHHALMTNPAFRSLFFARADQLLADDGPLGPASSLERWSSRKSVISPAVIAEAARWGGSGANPLFGVVDWLAETTWVEEQWFPSRTAIVRDQLDELLAAYDAPLATEPRTIEGAAPTSALVPAVRLEASG